MTIYNKTTLHNIFIKKQAAQAYAEGYLDKETLGKISAEHPSDLYTPNVFVSVGLGLLTSLVVLAATGIFFLLFNSIQSPLMFVMALACYAAIEMITGSKKHFSSGVDKVLMAAAAIFFISGLELLFHSSNPDTWLSFVLFFISGWFAIRFVDVIAACVAAISLLVFVFNAYSSLGQFTIFSFPFLLMVGSALIYFVAKRQSDCSDYFIYYSLFKAIKIVALFAFYLSGNYYVVKSIIEQNYLLNAQSVLSVASWFFWGWTFAIPVIYLVAGMKQKDIVLIRIGALLIVGSVLTFKYYFHVMSLEAALIFSGAILIVAGYRLMRFFGVARRGFIYHELTNKSKYEDAEAFILSQVMAPSAAPQQDTKLGGGSFGGAGSGSDF